MGNERCQLIEQDSQIGLLAGLTLRADQQFRFASEELVERGEGDQERQGGRFFDDVFRVHVFDEGQRPAADQVPGGPFPGFLLLQKKSQFAFGGVAIGQGKQVLDLVGGPPVKAEQLPPQQVGVFLGDQAFLRIQRLVFFRNIFVGTHQDFVHPVAHGHLLHHLPIGVLVQLFQLVSVPAPTPDQVDQDGFFIILGAGFQFLGSHLGAHFQVKRGSESVEIVLGLGLLEKFLDAFEQAEVGIDVRKRFIGENFLLDSMAEQVEPGFPEHVVLEETHFHDGLEG